MDRITYAPHLRGFVQIDRARPRLEGSRFHPSKLPHMRWGVINVVTGQVISSDGTCCTIADAVRDCDILVGHARGAWMHGFHRKELLRGGEGGI